MYLLFESGGIRIEVGKFMTLLHITCVIVDWRLSFGWFGHRIWDCPGSCFVLSQSRFTFGFVSIFIIHMHIDLSRCLEHTPFVFRLFFFEFFTFIFRKLIIATSVQTVVIISPSLPQSRHGCCPSPRGIRLDRLRTYGSLQSPHPRLTF